MPVCEATGNPEHDNCEHCGTCHTCCEEWDDQQGEARKQLNIALEKATRLLEAERKTKDRNINRLKKYATALSGNVKENFLRDLELL